MTIRPVAPTDTETWLAHRSALWPESIEDHANDIERFFGGISKDMTAVLVAEEAGTLVGFVELTIHAVAEGCTTDRIGYLEGWYVSPEARRRGVGRALVAAAEDWARGQGCREFASDTDMDNNVGLQAHLACGFEKVGRKRRFRKDL